MKQGDPLSGVLFNLVIDWALEALDPKLGFDVDGVKVNHLAFADDVILVSATKAGLQRQIDAFTSHLAESGLKVNAGKCASMSIRANGHTKKWVCDPTTTFSVQGANISPMTVSETYKYLGIHVSSRGSQPHLEEKLKKYLSNISRAPLKPQQRMWMLGVKVIPALFHQLVLADCTKGFMAYLDRIIRSSVRQWTKLPKDTPIPLFYASPKDGGLGLTALEFTVPALKARRLLNLTSSPDPVVRKIVNCPSFQRDLVKWSKPLKFRGQPMATSSLRRVSYQEELYKTVDGRGLAPSNLVPYAHSWVTAGTTMMSGAKFCAALAVRAGTLPTRARAARGRPEADPWCDCCGQGTRETLGHILNVCPRTHGPRVYRHDRVLAELEKALIKLGFTTHLEHHFKVGAGSIRKPDLLAYGQGKPSIILDVCICSDWSQDLNTEHFKKVNYYSQHDSITADVVRMTGSPPIFSALAISWRGCVAPQSARDLQTLGVKNETVGFLAAIAVEHGAVIHRIFNKSTLRVNPTGNQ